MFLKSAGDNKKIASTTGALQAAYVQQAGRPDYTAVIRRLSEQGDVWYCEHITHEAPADALVCAERELNRRAPKRETP